MTKPAVIWATQIFIAWFAIGAAGRAFLAVIGTLNGRCTIAQGVGGFLFAAALLFVAVWILIRISRQQIARRSVVIFLWVILALYPVTNLLRQLGIFPPQEPVADQELAGAAVAEVLRYVLVLGMIVWLSFTRRAAEYLASGLPHRTEDART